MTRKILLALLCCSVGLSGCERLSEKDKMEMITMCDTMARRQIKEKDEKIRNALNENRSNDLLGISRSIAITTHYSFRDSRCYAQKSNRTFFSGGNKREPSVWLTETLYDGMTMETLLTVALAGPSGPFDEIDGSLKTKEMTKEEASQIIKEKMNAP